MSKYKVGEIVISEYGFSKIMKFYKVINVKHIDNINELDDNIDFKYEWENKEEIYKDPYIYDIELHFNVCFKENSKFNEDEYNIFKIKKHQLSSQIQKITE